MPTYGKEIALKAFSQNCIQMCMPITGDIPIYKTDTMKCHVNDKFI